MQLTLLWRIMAQETERGPALDQFETCAVRRRMLVQQLNMTVKTCAVGDRLMGGSGGGIIGMAARGHAGVRGGNRQSEKRQSKQNKQK
jgi:hypothetical protein